MKIAVNLGFTINLGNYNTARIDVSVEGDPGESYEEVFNRAQGFYCDAAYHHVKHITDGEVPEIISRLSSKLRSEPRY